MDAPAVDPFADGPPARRQVFAAVTLPLVAIFTLTAEWGLPYHIDAMTNAITGWYLGSEGTVIATDHGDLATDEQYGNLGWFVTSPEGPVGQYPPGAAFVAGAFYAVAPDDAPSSVVVKGVNRSAPPVRAAVPEVWPATLSAVVATALCAGVLALVFLRLTDARTSIAGGLAFGVATGAWSVASSMSWTHGPAMLAVALALLGACGQRWLLCGLAFGFAVLTRPHLAVVALAVGIAASASRRSARPALLVGVGSGAGLAGLLLYNQAVFHRLSISGGYSDQFGTGLIAEPGVGWFLGNVLRAIVDPAHGLLPWAPFLVVLVPSAIVVRKVVPAWAVAAAAGGVLYLLIQYRANRFTGGEGHYGYRYPLEAMTAAAPALAVGYHGWVRERPVAKRLLVAGLAVAFAGQLVASLR